MLYPALGVALTGIGYEPCHLRTAQVPWSGHSPLHDVEAETIPCGGTMNNVP